ncbi:MAG: ATP-binding protein [Eubacteriales bacterium]|nr:ATP-binding protein [Eubacteriales bacterium]
MAYDGKVMRAALEQFQADKQRRSAQFIERQSRIFHQIPELQEIDRELRGTMSQIIASALQRGTDPLPAIRVIRDKNLDLQRRRAELLTENGFNEDALEEKPYCALCSDTGYRGGGVCACLQEYYNRAQITELSQMLDLGTQSFDTFDFNWYDADCHERSISSRERMEKNFDICQDFANEFGPRSGNLLLSGDPGLGKTFLSACIARVVSENGFSVVYDTAATIFARFEAAKFRRDEEDSSDEDVARYENCDLLILDDLGTEMTTTFVQSALYQLINGRLLAGKKTIISTNLNPDELGRRYSRQIQSRLEGEYWILPFFGEDIRKLKRERR